jgi:hypothetical protein
MPRILSVIIRAGTATPPRKTIRSVRSASVFRFGRAVEPISSPASPGGRCKIPAEIESGAFANYDVTT